MKGSYNYRTTSRAEIEGKLRHHHAWLKQVKTPQLDKDLDVQLKERLEHPSLVKYTHISQKEQVWRGILWKEVWRQDFNTDLGKPLVLAEYDLEGLDLSHLDLRFIRFGLIGLSWAEQLGIDIALYDLRGRTKSEDDILYPADLSHVDMRDSVLDYADFQDTDLSGANLEGASLVGVSFSGATMNTTRIDEKWKNCIRVSRESSPLWV